jgi:hypothetical protein
MGQQLEVHARHFARSDDDSPDYFNEIMTCHFDDPEKALAYVVIAASQSDDAAFLGYLGCGPLEDILHNPSPELLERIVAEARKSARFRWLLSNPFKVAIAPRAWEAIEKFRITGPHEEAPYETLPPRK